MLVELAVKFTWLAVIVNVPPKWLLVDPPAVTSGWSTFTPTKLAPMSTESTLALLVEVAVPVTGPGPYRDRAGFPRRRRVRPLRAEVDLGIVGSLGHRQANDRRHQGNSGSGWVRLGCVVRLGRQA